MKAMPQYKRDATILSKTYIHSRLISTCLSLTKTQSKDDELPCEDTLIRSVALNFFVGSE